MKIFKLILFSTMLALSSAALAEGTRYLIQVDGLACPLCAHAIEKQLKGIEGVIPDSIEVNLAEGRIRMDVRPDVTVSDAELESMITDAGFSYRGKTAEAIEPGGT